MVESVLAVDEAAKPWATLEKIAALPTVRGSQYVTAANSPGLESGAAMVVLMSRAAAERSGHARELAPRPGGLYGQRTHSPLQSGGRRHKEAAGDLAKCA